MPDARTQPWRAHWPPSMPKNNGVMGNYKAGEIFAVDGSDGSAAFGYNDQEDIIPPATGKDKDEAKEK